MSVDGFSPYQRGLLWFWGIPIDSSAHGQHAQKFLDYLANMMGAKNFYAWFQIIYVHVREN